MLPDERRFPKGLFALALCASCVAGDAGSDEIADRAAAELASIPQFAHRPVCPGAAAPGFARCHAHVRVGPSGEPFATNAPTAGFLPVDLASAYNLPSSGGAGITVAIVDAYDDPNAESDLALYRSTFGLPPCTTANGCFKKVNQNGATSQLPAANSGWAQEISLDLDMVSAACPQCKILLVETNSASITDLGTGVNTAAALGAAGYAWGARSHRSRARARC